MTKLFVGGLPYSIDNQKLNDLFSSYGQVASAIIIIDKITNQSKGFGFVEMIDDSAAQEAIKALDGSDLEGRRLGVSVARPREEQPRGQGDYRQDNSRRSGNNFSRGNNRRY